MRKNDYLLFIKKYSRGFIKCARDHFHYIRLSTQASQQTIEVDMEVLYTASTLNRRFSDLPNEFREIVKFFRGFRQSDESIVISADVNVAASYYRELIKQRKGSCRHRSALFLGMMQEKYPHITVQLIMNNNDQIKGDHVYGEILHNGIFYSCDLGGYTATVNYSNRNFPEGVNQHNKNHTDDPYDDPENCHTISVAPRGRPVTPDFFERASNIASVTMKINMSSLSDHVLARLDTLSLEDCDIDVNLLNRQLALARNLKTLNLINCRISHTDLSKLDFSTLSEIEYIKLVGAFIPDNAALKRLMSTVKHDIEWVIDSINIMEMRLTQRLLNNKLL